MQTPVIDFVAAAIAIQKEMEMRVAEIASLKEQLVAVTAERDILRARPAPAPVAPVAVGLMHIPSLHRKNLSANTKLSILRGEALDRRIADVNNGKIKPPQHRMASSDSPSSITPASWRAGGKYSPTTVEASELVKFMLDNEDGMQKRIIMDHFAPRAAEGWAKRQDGTGGILRELKEMGIISIVE
jgi:hypothetical protein